MNSKFIVTVSIKMLGKLVGGAEFAGPENGGPKKNKDWKMQDLQNDGLGYTSKLASPIADRRSTKFCACLRKNAKEQVVTVRTQNFNFFSEL